VGLQASVLGASGYTGGELLRLLAAHPAIGVAAVGAGARQGAPLGGVHPHLAGVYDLELTFHEEAARAEADVCFSCLPHGVLPGLAETVAAPLLVDLAEDFRDARGWVYGLSELARPQVLDANRIANPGCYPTAALLCLVPFARAGALRGPVIVDALSGTSGAGRKAEDALLFSSIDGGASAYGPVPHRHVAEIEGGLLRFAGVDARVSFTPHLVPMARGLLVTARFPLDGSMSNGEALEVLQVAYAEEPFVLVAETWPSTKSVAGTNRALVSARVDDAAGFVVCSAAIDNLGKGAAGQALQNANLALGLDETAGLAMVAAWP
jgi:N-acetyl-gamma-glutamyl-phosphate reductase